MSVERPWSNTHSLTHSLTTHHYYYYTLRCHALQYTHSHSLTTLTSYSHLLYHGILFILIPCRLPRSASTVTSTSLCYSCSQATECVSDAVTQWLLEGYSSCTTCISALYTYTDRSLQFDRWYPTPSHSHSHSHSHTAPAPAPAPSA
jgi:hypothetical protein